MRILLVEDDEIMRISVQDRLEKYGWHVDAATDGKVAIEMLEQAAYQIEHSGAKIVLVSTAEQLAKFGSLRGIGIASTARAHGRWI